MKAQTHTEAERNALDNRIRDGIIPWTQAERLIATQAATVRMDAWQLNINPIDFPKLRDMGLQRPIDIAFRYLHLFPVLLNADGQTVMAIHTMPFKAETPDMPDTMGGKNTRIRLFAMTEDASKARFERDQHRLQMGSAAHPLTQTARRAALIRQFADSVAELNQPYAVPISQVRDEFYRALRGFEGVRSLRHAPRRFVALQKLRAASDEALVRTFAKECDYPLAETGFNSNSGAGDLGKLLGHPVLPHTCNQAPLVDQSMLAECPDLMARLIRIDEPAPQPTAPSVRPKFVVNTRQYQRLLPTAAHA